MLACCKFLQGYAQSNLSSSPSRNLTSSSRASSPTLNGPQSTMCLSNQSRMLHLSLSLKQQPCMPSCIELRGSLHIMLG